MGALVTPLYVDISRCIPVTGNNGVVRTVDNSYPYGVGGTSLVLAVGSMGVMAGTDL